MADLFYNRWAMQGRHYGCSELHHFSMCQSGAVLFPLHAPAVIPMGSSCRGRTAPNHTKHMRVCVCVYMLFLCELRWLCAFFILNNIINQLEEICIE